MRSIFLLIVGVLAFGSVRAQVIDKKNVDSSTTRIDTLKKPGYINKGRIAGRKAIRRSLIVPGLGQMYNYGLVVDDVKRGVYPDKRVLQKIYIVGKISLIYAGGALLVSSYIDNNNKYKQFLRELQYRQVNPGKILEGNGLEGYTGDQGLQALYTGKAIYKNNREVVLISLAVLYGANVVDAYVTARLKYHDVDNQLSYKISPTLINASPVYGFKPVPGLKFSLKL
ncbi:DUF5683 domain-containing protein [Pedobacter sp. UC225_65]|uniref:DUF5683 domain-containing protein n=1 Tax=Pedobacter sp. UC225_65 TaxID=3350173 RepID=UPI00366C1457